MPNLDYPRQAHTHLASESSVMSDLAPEMWSKLPHDILFSIVDCLDIPDLIAWSCVSRTFFPYASARIWRTLRIKACHIESYRCLQESGIEGHKEALRHNFVHFLTHNAHRQDASLVFQGLRTLDAPMHMYRPNVEYPDQKFLGLSRMPASLPGSLARHLEISDREAPKHMDPKSGDVLSQLFGHLDGLRTVSYDGRLNSCTLTKITEIRTLTSLSLRFGSEVASLPPNLRLGHGAWAPLRLDLGVLSTLPHLRTLSVGHLTNGEAEGLARSIMSLKLETLHVSTTGWLILHGKIPRVTRNYKLASPLVDFLCALATLPLTDESQPRGFPLTLRSLVLCDRYFPWLPSLHQRLVSLITHCELLVDMKLGLLVGGLDPVKDGLRNLNIPAHNLIVRLQSWDQLSYNGEARIVYRYWSYKYDVDGSKTLVASRIPRSGCGRIINIARVLDENVAKYHGYGLTDEQQPQHYLRMMRFIKEPHGNCKTFQDGVVEVHWSRHWLLSSGKLSVKKYLRHIGFRKGSLE